MDLGDWSYDGARDYGLGFVERLRICPREPDLFVYGARVLAALAIRGSLRAFHRLRISGGGNVPGNGSFVLAANHSSHLDALALLSALPLRSLHRAYPVAASDYFGANRLRLICTTIVANVMLFDRDAGGVDGLRRCRRLLDGGDSVLLIFPEGTRSSDGSIGVFRRGIGRLLAGTTHPVVPCHIDGTFRAWPRGRAVPRPSRVRIDVGRPRRYEDVPPNETGILRVCSDLRDAVLSLSPQARPHSARVIPEEVYS
jgi:1-acyl-sn-glycerol-3-phosphate acyltransferase